MGFKNFWLQEADRQEQIDALKEVYNKLMEGKRTEKTACTSAAKVVKKRIDMGIGPIGMQSTPHKRAYRDK